MSDRNVTDHGERKDLPQDATPKEKLKYIKELTLFNKSMFGDTSWNEMQCFLDKIIKICNI